jgi:hypothetical protein
MLTGLEPGSWIVAKAMARFGVSAMTNAIARSTASAEPRARYVTLLARMEGEAIGPAGSSILSSSSSRRRSVQSRRAGT